MPTGKDTKNKIAKVRKPTQLDRIEKSLQALNAKVDRLPVDIGIMLKSNDLIKEVEGHKEEPWVPKVGGLAKVYGKVGKIVNHIDWLGDQWFFDGGPKWVLNCELIEPSKEEIAAFQQAEKEREWAKVTELMELDATDVASHEWSEIVKLAASATTRLSHLDWQLGSSETRRLIFERGLVKIGVVGGGGNLIHLGEFRRRLEGTVARIKREKDEEKAKMLERVNNLKSGELVKIRGKNTGIFIAHDGPLAWVAHKDDGSYYADLYSKKDDLTLTP